MVTILVSTLKDAGALDFKSTFFNVLVILIAAIVILDAIAKLCNYIGKPVKWIKKNDKDHESIARLEERLNEIEDKFQKRVDFMENTVEEMKRTQKDKIDSIGRDLTDLKQMVIDDRINRMRNLILNISAAVTNNQIVSKEQYENALAVYDEYEQFLAEHKMSNGRVDISIGIIKKGYKELLEKEKDVKKN